MRSLVSMACRSMRAPFGHMTAGRIQVVALALASLCACRRFGDDGRCRNHGVTFRQTEAGVSDTRESDISSKDDALTIMAYPGWRARIAKYDPDALSGVDPLLGAIDRSLLSHLRPDWNHRQSGLYTALGQLLTLDPTVTASALDERNPIIVKVRPAGRQTVAVFMQIMPIPATELPPPDLLARVVVPSKAPASSLAHLQRIIVKEESCIPAPTAGYAAICELRGRGFVGLSVGEGAVHLDLVSDDDGELRDRLTWYLQVLRAAPQIDRAEIRSATEEMSRDKAALTVIVPGGQVAPLGQVFALSGYWSFVLGCATGKPFPGMQYALPLLGRDVIPAYLLSLPEYLELRTVRVALVLEDSMRIIADASMTNHGAELLARGFERASNQSSASPVSFNIGRAFASSEPMPDLYDDDVKPRPVSKFSVSQFGLLQYLLQSPVLVMKTLASTIPADQGTPQELASIVGDRLGFEDVSWRVSGAGQGTVAHISARGPKEELASVRVWLESNRRVRAEACILPDRMPCKWSRVSDEVVLEGPHPPAQVESSPCWGYALAGLHRMLAEMVSLRGLRFDDSAAWFEHAIPLHRDLVCAKGDPRVAEIATDIDDALQRFVARKGNLIPWDGKPITRKRFPWPKQTEPH